MSSTFPQQLDIFPEFEDISLADALNLKGYQQAMQDGNMELANQYLQNISNYQNKIITAEKLNAINDAISAVENFYLNEIESKIEDSEFKIQNETFSLMYQGHYNDTVAYVKNNIVMSNDKVLYICIQTPPSAGYDINNPLYWLKFTVKGANGEVGQEIYTSFLGVWENDVEYLVNNMVIFNNAWWVAKQRNTNVQPSLSSSQWQEVMTITQNLYQVGVDEPQDQREGELWLEVIG